MTFSSNAETRPRGCSQAPLLDTLYQPFASKARVYSIHLTWGFSLTWVYNGSPYHGADSNMAPEETSRIWGAVLQANFQLLSGAPEMFETPRCVTPKRPTPWNSARAVASGCRLRAGARSGLLWGNEARMYMYIWRSVDQPPPPMV